MNNPIFRMEEDIAYVYKKYIVMVYRVSFIMLENTADAEDAAQTVFLKYIVSNTIFENEHHLKAWLITTTRNECRNMLRNWWRKNRSSLDDVTGQGYVCDYPDHTIWSKVSALKEKCKLPIYLYYYEGYKTEEISQILEVNHATIRTRLKTARKKLKLMIEEEDGLE